MRANLEVIIQEQFLDSVKLGKFILAPCIRQLRCI